MDEVDGSLVVGCEDTGVDLEVVDSSSKSGCSVDIVDGSRGLLPGAKVTASVLTGWGCSIGSSICIFSLQLSLSEQQIYSSVAELKEPSVQI